VKWVQFATNEAWATFLVEGDTVLVHFQKTDESAWRASFEVEKSSKSPTQLESNSVRILSGVFPLSTGVPGEEPLRMDQIGRRMQRGSGGVVDNKERAQAAGAPDETSARLTTPSTELRS
jgi:hypothetical protein